MYHCTITPLAAAVFTYVLRERVGAQVMEHGSGAGGRRVRRERARALRADPL